MITVPGRILQPPSVLYFGKKPILVGNNGAWNMKNTKYSVSAQLPKWTFLKISYASEPEDNPLAGDVLQQRLREFLAILKDSGMRIAPHGPKDGIVKVLSGRPGDDANYELLSAGFKSAADMGVKFLLVILSNENRLTYARVKKLGDMQFGIPTVCVLAGGFASKGPRYMANVGLKVNIKFGGANQSLSPLSLGIIRDGRTMVVGIDVTHPSQESVEGAPSIAGVVASVDCNLTQWPASIRIQEGRKEMVEELGDMIKERLRVWRQRNNGELPNKILVYRDGVSEGQYEIVLAEELPSIRRACELMYPANGPKPKISIVIVGKRHHTRFYPVKADDADNDMGNPKHGTVVDRGVTYERKWDFFLQAHHGLKGTARPAHYVVVLDEISLGANGLEQLVRCSGRIPYL
jgi:eukaryotic translation initiation factor 2C